MNNIKRAELHIHTKLSDDISVIGVCEIFEKTQKLGLKSIAFTNLNNVQDFPEIMKYAKKYENIKVIYGVEVKYKSNADSPYRPMGFISRQEENLQHSLLGMKVYPVDDHLIFKMKEKGVNDVIISPLVMQKINPLKDLAIFLDNNINLLVTPYFTDFSTEKVEQSISERVGRIESIKVEDLLERPVINLNDTEIQQILENNTVMITGAAGSIGSEIVRQVAKRNPSGIILLEIAESPLHDLIIDIKPQFPNIKFIHVIADVRNRTMIEPIFKEYKPKQLQ